MKKNFRFKLKFLDGLKKKPTSSVDEPTEDVQEDIHEEIREEIHEEPPPEIPVFAPKERKVEIPLEVPAEKVKQTLVQKIKSKFADKTSPNIPPSVLEVLEVSDLPNLPPQPKVAKQIRIKLPNFSNFPKFPKISRPQFSKPKFNSPMDKFQKFNWNDFVTRLFSPYSRGKIHAWFFILIIITSTYLAGKTVALFFSKSNTIVSRPPPPPATAMNVDTSMQDINKITTANLFNIKENEKAANGADTKKDIASIICLDGDRPTTLSAKLMDTVILKDSIKSVASVQMRGSEDLLNLREGEKIEDNTEITKITRQKLILKNLQTGECEYLMADGDDNLQMPSMKILSAKEGRKLFKSMNPNIKNVGNNFKIKKAYRETMMNNVSEILTQAKAIQITNPDGSMCFKMTEVVPGSLYTQLDIQENDIVCSVNGKKIDNLNELMGFLGKIREVDNMQIGVNRNGMSENKEYNFE